MTGHVQGASDVADQALVSDQAASRLAPSGFDPSRILLRCTECRSEQMVERDESDPPKAVRAEMACPECWDGDFDAPEFFDANGDWVNPVEHLS